jgi:hypothetical protein
MNPTIYLLPAWHKINPSSNPYLSIMVAMSRTGLQLGRYSHDHPTDTPKQSRSLAMLNHTLYLDGQLWTALYRYGLPQHSRLRRNSQLQEWWSLAQCQVTDAAGWEKGTVCYWWSVCYWQHSVFVTGILFVTGSILFVSGILFVNP